MNKTEIPKDGKSRIITALLVVFLLIMLVLTFFSNTIMNRSLPEITTVSVSSGKLTEAVRCQGIVEAEQSYEVKVNENRTVQKMYIKEGQRINEGDKLFTLGSGQSDSISAAEAELTALELEYSKLLIKAPADYTSENMEIRNAAEDLQQAIDKRDKAYAAQSEAESARKQYDSDKAEAAEMSALKEQLSAAISAIDNDDYSNAPAGYIGDLIALKNNWQAAENEYASAYKLYTEELKNNSEDVKNECDEKDTKRTNAKAEYDRAKSSIRSELAVKLNDISNKLETLNSRISSYETNAQSGGMSYEECAADVQAKQRALESLRVSLAKTQSTDSIAQQQYDLDLKSKSEIIEKKKSDLEKLRKNSDSIDIVSRCSGTVRKINIKLDDMTAADSPLAIIDIDSVGYTVKANVEASVADKVKTGVSAKPVNIWNSNISAVLSDIRNDSEGNSKVKTLIFDVKGDVTAGMGIELSIPLSTNDYNAIVPKSAVFEDQDGGFVYKVRSKNTPIGNRYYAERVAVTVLADDGTSCAVEGDVNGSDSIITAFSKPVNSGDQVRLKSD